jgi:hypothetical protein
MEENVTGILDMPFPWNVIGSAAAILLIGTFLWKMVKKEWWWDAMKKTPPKAKKK